MGNQGIEACGKIRVVQGSALKSQLTQSPRTKSEGILSSRLPKEFSAQYCKDSRPRSE
jgi:hypothetical protein